MKIALSRLLPLFITFAYATNLPKLITTPATPRSVHTAKLLSANKYEMPIEYTLQTPIYEDDLSIDIDGMLPYLQHHTPKAEIETEKERLDLLRKKQSEIQRACDFRDINRAQDLLLFLYPLLLTSSEYAIFAYNQLIVLLLHFISSTLYLELNASSNDCLYRLNRLVNTISRYDISSIPVNRLSYIESFLYAVQKKWFNANVKISNLVYLQDDKFTRTNKDFLNLAHKATLEKNLLDFPLNLNDSLFKIHPFAEESKGAVTENNIWHLPVLRRCKSALFY